MPVEVEGGSICSGPFFDRLQLEFIILMVKEKTKEIKMKKYVCDVCGYVYDPATGDSEFNIPAGTAFEDLPDDWVCPECGVGKENFSEQA